MNYITSDINTFIDMLRSGVVEFTYIKANGETRQARGTKLQDPSIVGENFVAPKGSGPERTGIITYWDLDKDGWRCLREDSFMTATAFTSKEDYNG